MHGDNIKPYKGAERLDWFQVPPRTVEVIVFPCLQVYKRILSKSQHKSENLESFSEGVSQCVSLSPTSWLVDRVAKMNY